nr:hypothetical protein [uncultured Methanoregula sp.]
MDAARNGKNTDTLHRYGDDLVEKIPMHPDDFKAHLDWVTAKRFHEQGNGTFREKPAYCRIG